MTGKVSGKFQWLLHLSFLQIVIRNNPSTYEDRLNEIGTNIGRRLLGDFCSRFSIWKKIQDIEAEQYLKTFLGFYFDDDIVFDNERIVFTVELLHHQRRPGGFLIKKIIETVFCMLNDRITFGILDDNTISVQFN